MASLLLPSFSCSLFQNLPSKTSRVLWSVRRIWWFAGRTQRLIFYECFWRKHDFKGKCQPSDGTTKEFLVLDNFLHCTALQPSSADGKPSEAPSVFFASRLQPIFKFSVKYSCPLGGDIICYTLVDIQMVIKSTSCCLLFLGTLPIHWQYVDWEVDSDTLWSKSLYDDFFCCNIIVFLKKW